MNKKGSFKELKVVIKDIVDGNGNIRTFPVGALAKRDLDDNRLDIIKSLVRLCLDTDFFCYETKMYLENYDLSMSKIYRHLVEDGVYLADDDNEFKKGERKVINKIANDQRKLDIAIGENVVTDLYNKSVPVGHYMIAIKNQYGKLGGSSLRDNLHLNLDKKVIVSELDDDDFEALMRTIYPYTNMAINEAIESLGSDKVGYFNYLMTCPDGLLSELDFNRKNELVNILK